MGKPKDMKAAQCQLCGRWFSRAGLAGHMRWKHGRDPKAPMVPVDRQPSMATLRELEHGVRQLQEQGIVHEEALRVLASCRGLALSLPGYKGDAEDTAKAANVFLKAYLAVYKDSTGAISGAGVSYLQPLPQEGVDETTMRRDALKSAENVIKGGQKLS